MSSSTESVFAVEDGCATNGILALNVCTNPDECLAPLDRLQKYANSDIVFHRQVATRSILETLHDVRENEEDVQIVFSVLSKFATDAEPSIRVELVEQLPHIASYILNQMKSFADAFFAVLPFFEQFLTDSSVQVRKVSQNSLAVMLEQGFIGREFVETKICKVLTNLMEFNLDDYRMEAIITVSKMIRFLGKETTEKLFINHFTRLCSDSSFNVRRVCASNFGEFCSVIGQDLTEELLLPHFKLLCEDGVWGVRKACADVFVPVSCVCSNEARRNTLASLFVNLLCDHSRWVKTAAFQALGPFISTFADPSKTGLYYNNGTVVVVDDIKDIDSNDSGCSVDSSENVTSPEVDDCDLQQLQCDLKRVSSTDFCEPDSRSTFCDSEVVHKTFQLDNNSAFNNFQYWRIPIPELELDIERGECTQIPVRVHIENDSKKDVFSTKLSDVISQEDNGWTMSSEVDVACFSNLTNSSRFTTNGENIYCVVDDEKNLTTGIKLIDIYDVKNQLRKSQQVNSQLYTVKAVLKQNIIPSDLLEHYLNMINPVNYQTIDPELSHHCAYSLPAVALTLGRKYWPCLKETYETLASDMQWSVRWTLASSLHQMSLILGPEYTSRDLLPVFLNFMKDLDEVRFGILQNLAAILELFTRTEQLGILPKISDFLKMDNHRNWRFRLTLAHQVIAVSSLYSPTEIKQYLVPIAFTLVNDKVAEVRLSAISVLSNLLKRIFCDHTSTLNDIQSSIINEIRTSLALSSKWVLRQAFVLLCERIVVDKSISVQIFNQHILECLLKMSSDNVPNVRLVLARVLSSTMSGFRGVKSVEAEVNKLQNDSDYDVRRYLISSDSYEHEYSDKEEYS